MRWTGTISHELLCARRERLPQFLLLVFVSMIAASAFIGSSARATVSNVYQQARNQGLTTAANPFDGLSPLYYARNMVIYIVLIGALLAIVVGVRSTLRDRQARTTDLMLSRDVRPAFYLGSKLAGLALFMLILLAVSTLISIGCISAVAGQFLTPGESARIVGLYALAWLFLLPFVALGMLAGLYAATATSALLIPVVIWSLVVFVLPLLGTAAHPVSLLNPVAGPTAAQTGFFALSSAVTGPLSLAEQFKHVSSLILADQQATGTISSGLAIILVFAVVGCAAVALTTRGRIRSTLRD
ncbi:MAG: ABC transporter permease [Acidobacteria bacterium]|nr:ABC transporter permease [Acidobacteriota bacterium]